MSSFYFGLRAISTINIQGPQSSDTLLIAINYWTIHTCEHLVFISLKTN